MEKLDVYEANYQFVRTANEPQYASGAVYPFTAATAYLDTPEEIEQYDPFDNNN